MEGALAAATDPPGHPGFRKPLTEDALGGLTPDSPLPGVRDRAKPLAEPPLLPALSGQVTVNTLSAWGLAGAPARIQSAGSPVLSGAAMFRLARTVPKGVNAGAAGLREGPPEAQSPQAAQASLMSEAPATDPARAAAQATTQGVSPPASPAPQAWRSRGAGPACRAVPVCPSAAARTESPGRHEEASDSRSQL